MPEDWLDGANAVQAEIDLLKNLHVSIPGSLRDGADLGSMTTLSSTLVLSRRWIV